MEKDDDRTRARAILAGLSRLTELGVDVLELIRVACELAPVGAATRQGITANEADHPTGRHYLPARFPADGDPIALLKLSLELVQHDRSPSFALLLAGRAPSTARSPLEDVRADVLSIMNPDFQLFLLDLKELAVRPEVSFLRSAGSSPVPLLDHRIPPLPKRLRAVARRATKELLSGYRLASDRLREVQESTLFAALEPLKERWSVDPEDVPISAPLPPSPPTAHEAQAEVMDHLVRADETELVFRHAARAALGEIGRALAGWGSLPWAVEGASVELALEELRKRNPSKKDSQLQQEIAAALGVSRKTVARKRDMSTRGDVQESRPIVTEAPATRGKTKKEEGTRDEKERQHPERHGPGRRTSDPERVAARPDSRAAQSRRLPRGRVREDAVEVAAGRPGPALPAPRTPDERARRLPPGGRPRVAPEPPLRENDGRGARPRRADRRVRKPP